MPRRASAADPDHAMPDRTVAGRHNPEVIDGCGDPLCGTDSERSAPRGWVSASVKGSTLPRRWFCSSRCAAVGIALAQLRLTPPLK